jgi:hypothetical protein
MLLKLQVFWDVMLYHWGSSKKKKGKAVPLQAWTGP